MACDSAHCKTKQDKVVPPYEYGIALRYHHMSISFLKYLLLCISRDFYKCHRSAEICCHAALRLVSK